MEEFMVEFLLLYPWPSINICQCRVSGNNIFEDQGRWKYRFTADETSNKCVPEVDLDEEIVPRLKFYLDDVRMHLVKSKETEALFLNYYGNPLTERTLFDLVMSITLRYAGARVSPQTFRDIWAYNFLEHFPEDYDALAPHLWQQVSSTRRLYGGD
jgi:hypothetical protein